VKLEVAGLVKEYPSISLDPAVRALDDVTFGIEPGEIVALTGPSGSGKSTLLQIIATIAKPDQGTVRLDDECLSALGEREAQDFRLRRLGFITQTPRLIRGLSAMDTAILKLMFAGERSRRQAQRDVAQAMERLELSDRAHHRAQELSVGERQRVAIVQALSCRPRLVLADEPTASLDPVRARTAMSLLADFARDEKASVLLVTHDPEIAAMADRELTLVHGRLAAGAPSAAEARVTR
jgi:putative ABC transport system ATP-binding protein